MSNAFKNLTHSPWPLIERLKHPKRSPDKLSAPHCKTMASGRNLDIISCKTFRLKPKSYRLEYVDERVVVQPFAERKIHRVKLSLIDANVLQMSSPGKIVLKLVKRAGHDPVGQIKSLFDPVAVMDIDIDVQNPLIRPKFYKQNRT